MLNRNKYWKWIRNFKNQTTEKKQKWTKIYKGQNGSQLCLVVQKNDHIWKTPTAIIPF